MGSWWSGSWTVATPTSSSVSLPTLEKLSCRTSITQDGFAEPNYWSLGMWAGPPSGLCVVWLPLRGQCPSVLKGSQSVLSGKSLSPVPRGTFTPTGIPGG